MIPPCVELTTPLPVPEALAVIMEVLGRKLNTALILLTASRLENVHVAINVRLPDTLPPLSVQSLHDTLVPTSAVATTETEVPCVISLLVAVEFAG